MGNRCGLCGLPVKATGPAAHTERGQMVLSRLPSAIQRSLDFGFEPAQKQQDHARVTRWAEAMIAEGLSLCFAQGETKAEQELSRTSEDLRGIGQYLVSHYVVREIESMLRRASRTGFVLKGKVKVTFSLFQGRKYVASVLNGQEQQPGNSPALFVLDPGETAHAIHIAENHLGVVDLVVADLGHAFQAEQVAGICWRAIYIPCGRCLIMATNDIWWGSIGGNGDAMGLRTSKGREVFLGFVGAIPDLDWELASTPAMNDYRFYYDSMSSMGIGGLAFEDPSPVTQGVQPFDPTTVVPPMPDFRYCVEPFFLSSANLQGLSKITVCRIPDKRGVSGVLLTFTNGHKEALGEVRLSCLEPPIDVYKQDRIWLRFEYDPTGIIDEHPRLVEISFSRIEPIIRDGTDLAIAGINCLEVLFTDDSIGGGHPSSARFSTKARAACNHEMPRNGSYSMTK
ncbi:hypothetical protein FMUND_13222 [Fusarium mundagurra]|uniref:Uncharacterized protein n=1 Tax=Fusarium mundagurra TaxID=1567541 RepID=A0A8H6D3I2_9HYPO|nr:hypothetical protein FMUND_13222 [Fusarium mundagurra]